MATTESARHNAEQFLLKLLASQPNLLQAVNKSDTGGKGTAQFCITFIETYAAHLDQRTK